MVRSTKYPRPFLKWAGGKDRLADQIIDLMPERIGRYFEPFLGAGAVFLALRRTGFLGEAILGDLNSDLIECWAELAINDHAAKVTEWLDQQPTTEAAYYRIRAIDPMKLEPIARAARFIYLNKTCFNGLYRLGPDQFGDRKRLIFNVPWGKRTKVSFYEPGNLKRIAEALESCALYCADFATTLRSVRPGDVVYFDPPYVPIKRTSFTEYTGDSFGYSEQEKLAEEFERLVGLGARVILSNLMSPWVVDRYRAYEIHTVSAARSISSDGNRRQPVDEVLIVGRRKDSEWQSRAGSREPKNDSAESVAKTQPRHSRRTKKPSARSSRTSKKPSNHEPPTSDEESGSSPPSPTERSSEPPSSSSSTPRRRRPIRTGTTLERPPSPDSNAVAVAESTATSLVRSASKRRSVQPTTTRPSRTDKALYKPTGEVRLMAIDPGDSWSGLAVLESNGTANPTIQHWVDQITNHQLLGLIESNGWRCTHLAIETMQSRGMPLHWQSLLTLEWVGRFVQAWQKNDPNNHRSYKLVREVVKMGIMGTPVGDDRDVVKAVVGRFGATTVAGIERKHAIQAVALGAVWFDILHGRTDVEGRPTR